MISALRQLIGLFVDDGAFALWIIGVIAASAILAALIPNHPLVGGSVPALGCPSVLLLNAMLAAA